jgi:hypothetical protein
MPKNTGYNREEFKEFKGGSREPESRSQEALGRASLQLEGSRFGSNPKDPVIFVMARTWLQISLNRRLPGAFLGGMGFIGARRESWSSPS